MDVTDVIGSFGNFQLRLLSITAFRSLCSAFMRFNYNYITRTPEFQCADDFLNFTDGNTTFEIKNYDEKTGMDRCYRDNLDDDIWNNSAGERVPCQRFIYDPAMRSATIVEEWDLVCWNTWLISLGYMLNSIGGFIIYIPAGYLSDRYGRRPMVLIGQIMICLSTCLLGFSNSIGMYLALRLFLSIGHGCLGTSASCLFMENVGPRKRHVTIVLVAIGGFSSILLASVAFLLGEWRTLVLLSSLPLQLPLLFMIWKFMPESTRWLLTAKQYEKAEKQIIETARINGISIHDRESVMAQLEEKIEMEDGKERKPGSLIQVLKNKKVRKVALIVYSTYAIRAVISGGFTISLNQLGGSFYFNMGLLGVIRVFVALCNFYIVKKLNRKVVMFFSFTTTAALFLGSAVVPKKLLWLKITMSMLGKLTHGLSSTLLYLLSVEMFPTKMRASAMTGSKMASRIGHLAAPLTDLVGRMYGKSIPLVIYGVLATICCILLYFLPETKHTQLPDTVRDFEKLHEEKQTSKENNEPSIKGKHHNEEINKTLFNGKLSNEENGEALVKENLLNQEKNECLFNGKHSWQENDEPLLKEKLCNKEKPVHI